jgi:hypothetical protein
MSLVLYIGHPASKKTKWVGSGENGGRDMGVAPDEANTCFGTCDFIVDMRAENKSVELIAKFLTIRDIFFSRAVHCISVFILEMLQCADFHFRVLEHYV